MKLIFIQTGGTIDKDYPHTTRGWAFEFGEPASKRILEKLNPSFEYEIIKFCQKDSLEITNQDRSNLADFIDKYDGDKFIITHGTDSFLSARIKNKLIIITGSMLPERFSNSEASINLGSAMAAANILEQGVYIAMHGIVKPALSIQRNLKTGKFY